MPDTTHAPSSAAHLSPAAKARLDTWLADTVAARDHPAIHVGATTVEGPIYFSQAGERVFGEPEKGEVGEDTQLQLFSMTKLVTSVAILQLVEGGKVDLDSEAVLATHCPELVALPILKGITDGVPELVARKSPLTVRHLLTHTSGLAYDFTSPLLAEYSKVTGKPSHWAASVEGYTLPLIFEPGSHWVYSTGIDWAGILIERVSGKRLSAYFHDHIFAPLGLTEAQIGFFPTDGVKAHLQQVCGRVADPAPGAPRLEHTSSPRTFDMAKMASSQLGGGGGLFGTARAYLRFLQGILASAAPGGILTPTSYKELFTDSLPARGDGNTVHEGLTSMARLFGYADPDHVANSAQHLGHSVGLLLNDKDSVHGRRAGTGCWSGLARTYYWLDPATGIAAICFTQVLCQPPDPFTEVYNQYERLLYDCLDESAGSGAVSASAPAAA